MNQEQPSNQESVQQVIAVNQQTLEHALSEMTFGVKRICYGNIDARTGQIRDVAAEDEVGTIVPGTAQFRFIINRSEKSQPITGGHAFNESMEISDLTIEKGVEGVSDQARQVLKESFERFRDQHNAYRAAPQPPQS